jgi:phage terminase large subunit-like protein
VEEYIGRLRERLGATLAAKLANGDWTAVEGAAIDADDLRYYTTRGEIISPLGLRIGKDRRQMQRFAIIDTAGTSKQKAAENRGKPPSWSVCGVFDYWPEVGLFLRHVWRKRVGWPELRDEVQDVLSKWENPNTYVENAHHGPVLAAELNANLLPSRLPGMKGSVEGAKYDRAVASGLLAGISAHELYLPDVSTVHGAAGWMPEFESELLGWTGHPDETSDQVDVCSYAFHRVRSSQVSWGGVLV